MNNISLFFFLICFFSILFIPYCFMGIFFKKQKGDRRLKKIRIVIWGSFLFFFGLGDLLIRIALVIILSFEGLKTVWDGYSYGYVLSEYDWEPGFITVVYLLKSIIPNYFVCGHLFGR